MSSNTSAFRTALRKPLVKALLVAVVGVLVIFVWFKVDQAQDRQKVEARVEAAFAEVLPRSDADMAAKATYLRSIGVVSDEVASSTADVCYIDHDDSGWFAVDYNQNCYLVTVKGFAVPPGGANPNALPSQLSPEWERSAQPCQLLTAGGGFGYERKTSVTTCEPPEPASTKPIVVYAADDARTKILSQTGPGWQSPRGSVVWVTQYTPYLEEDLGCAPLSFLFCDSPRDEPITAT